MTASTKILDVASGFVISKCYELTGRPTLCKEIDAQVPEGLDIHILTDNSATYKTPKIKPRLLSCCAA